MTILIVLFFVSLLPGQLTGITLASGVTLYLHDIVLVGLLAAMVISLFQKHWHRPQLLLPIFGFSAISILSLLLNTSKFSNFELAQAGLYGFRWLVYALLYVTVVQRIVPQAVWLWGLYATGVSFAVLGLLQYVLYPALQNLSYLGWDPHYYRVFSTLLDPNFTGIILVFTLFLGGALSTMQKGSRWWFVISQGVTMLAFLLTYSRSSYLAFLVAVVVWIVMRRKWKLGVLGVLAFVLVILLLPQHGMDVLRLTRLDSTVARIGNWKESLAIIAQSPIVGHGFNSLRFLRQQRGEIDGLIISKAGAGMDSSLLFIGATTGFVGLGFYAWLWYKAVMMAGGVRNKKMTELHYVYLLTLVSLFVHGLFVNSAFYPWVMLWVWILTGVIEEISDSSTLPRLRSGSLRMTYQK